MTGSIGTCHFCFGRGVQGGCRACGNAGQFPAVSVHQPPPGCICPPGANLTCENPACPRKPARSFGTIGGTG